MPSGKLKKIDEPVKKDEEKKKKKKHKSNVKFTDRKSSKQVSSEDASDGRENSTGHPTRQDKNLGLGLRRARAAVI